MTALQTAPAPEFVDDTLRETTMPASSDSQRHAFEDEALPYLDPMYRLALRLARDPVLAEDLVQETMLKAYRSWSRYQPGTNVRAWLFTILRNTFISEYRQRGRHVDSVVLTDVESYTVFADVQEADPAGRFFDLIVDEEVLRAVDELPHNFRETLVLSDVEGLPYSEVAEVVGVPVGTVKSRLHRARRVLQRKLYDYAVEMGYIAPRAALTA